MLKSYPLFTAERCSSMISLSIHAERLRTKLMAFDLSMGCTYHVTSMGMGRSTMSAKARSESSEPNFFMTSTCPYTPLSSWKQSLYMPSGLKSICVGAMQSLVVCTLRAEMSRW